MSIYKHLPGSGINKYYRVFPCIRRPLNKTTAYKTIIIDNKGDVIGNVVT